LIQTRTNLAQVFPQLEPRLRVGQDSQHPQKNDDGAPMKIVAEYLEHARHFELIAAGEKKPNLRIALERQALMYRRRAEVRANQLGNPLRDRGLIVQQIT